MELKFDAHRTALLKRNIKQNRSYLQYAEDLLGGQYLIDNSLSRLAFEENIDWDIQTDENSRTTQVYLHAMNYLNHLVYAYNETGEGKYLKKGAIVLEDWQHHHSYIEKHETENNLAWNEHAVSSRVINALWLKAHAPDLLEAENQFGTFIQQHLDFLTDGTNYIENNHGIMMDKAILIIALFMEDGDTRRHYINIAKKRLEKVLLRDFSYQNVHLENSPEYHRLVVRWLTELAKLLKEMNVPFHKKYYSKIKRAKDYYGYIIDYNKQLPLIGDTGASKMPVDKIHEDFFDAEAGICIFNDEKKRSTLVFNVGFQSKAHKHQDDLSFIFSVKQENIFADSGKYSYARNDPYRAHITSPAAHTTLLIEGESYPLDDVTGDIKLTSNYTTEQYKYVSGEHHMYEGSALKRHLIMIEGDKLFIVDEVKSNEPKRFVQNFMLDDSIHVEKKNEQMVHLHTAKNDYQLRTHTGDAEVNIFHGQKDSAVISKKFSELIDTHRIEIGKDADHTYFFTSFVSIEDKVKLTDLDENTVSFHFNGQAYEIPLQPMKKMDY